MASLRLSVAANILLVIIGRMAVGGQSTNDVQTVEDCYKVNENKELCFKAISRNNRGSQLLSWPNARDWCLKQGDGYTLAIIRDEESQQAVHAFLIDYDIRKHSVWIGAQQTNNANWTWIDGTVEPPDNVGGHRFDNETVATLSSSLQSTQSFMSAALIHRHKYICQFEGAKCRKFVNDSGYRSGLDNECYVTFPRFNEGARLSWYQARSSCLHFGGDFARSRAVLNVTSSSWPGYENYTVGLRRNQFVWVDTGEAVGPYNNFPDSQPRWLSTGSCVVLQYGNHETWYSENCTYPQLFICSKVNDLQRNDPSDITTKSSQSKEEFRSPSLPLVEMIIIIVGAAVVFIICIIITVFITRACVRRSPSSTSDKAARPKVKPEKKETPAKPPPPKKYEDEDNRYDEFGGQHQIDYQFGETDVDAYQRADNQYYPADSVYSNAHEFPPAPYM